MQPTLSTLRALALIFLFLNTLSLRAEIRKDDTVTIDQILQHAAYNSPKMIDALIDVATKDADRLRGWATYLPEVSANFQAGGFHLIQKSLSGDPTRIGGSYSVSASHPVYHWGAVSAKRAQGFAEESIAQKRAIIDYIFLIVNLRQSYNNLIVKKFELLLNEKKIEDEKSLLEKYEILAKQGHVAQTTVEQHQLELQNLELERTFNVNTLNNELVEFKNDSGYLELQISHLPSEIKLPTIDLSELEKSYNQFINAGFDQSLLSDLAKENNELIESQLTIVKSRAKPVLNFSGGMQQQPAQINNSYEIQTQFFFGFSGSWTLFDRQETSFNKRSLRLKRRQVKTTLATEKANLFARAKNALDLIRTSQQSFHLRQQQVNLINDKLKLSKAQFKMGTIDRSSLNEAEQALLETQTALMGDKAKLSNAYHAFLGAIFSDEASRYFDPTSKHNDDD